MADLNEIEPKWRTLVVAGYGIGMRNDLFLTCQELRVGGTELPEFCVPGSSSADFSLDASVG